RRPLLTTFSAKVIFLLYLPPAPLLLSLFFNPPATTDIYTLSLHDALPISMKTSCRTPSSPICSPPRPRSGRSQRTMSGCRSRHRSEEHTSELQSPDHLVCRLLLEKKKEQICAYNTYR